MSQPNMLGFGLVAALLHAVALAAGALH